MFDWITPLMSLLSASGSDRLAVSAGNYDAARKVLKHERIRCHWPGITGDLCVFDVDTGQGKRAEQILRKAGLL